MNVPSLFNIYWIDLSGAKGHEQFKTRPGLIVAAHETGLAMVIPLTSDCDASRFPHTLQIPKDSTNQLNKDSVALIFQLRCIDFGKRCRGSLGKVSEIFQDLIKDSLRDFLGLS